MPQYTDAHAHTILIDDARTSLHTHTHKHTHSKALLLLHFSSLLFFSLYLALSLLLLHLTALNFISLATCGRDSAIHLPAEHHNVLPTAPHTSTAPTTAHRPQQPTTLSTTKWTQKFERSKTFAACF